MPTPRDAERPRLGVSACLLGREVRYDGGHKRSPFLTDVLGEFVEWVPVCPEVECGLPVPREPMQLAGEPSSPRLVTVRTGRDHTARMLGWVGPRVEGLREEGLSGFVFKSKSPSCGVRGIPVHGRDGAPLGKGPGLFARAVMDRFPLLPVVDARRLRGHRAREHFVERVFALARYRDFLKSDGSPEGLAEFHTRHNLQLMARRWRRQPAMDRLVAGAGGCAPSGLLDRYEELFMAALGVRAMAAGNAAVLLHVLETLQDRLSPAERRAAAESVERYRGGRAPLVEPIELMSRHARRCGMRCLERQTYLCPGRVELNLPGPASSARPRR